MKTPSKTVSSLKERQEQLRGAGLRSTTPRLAVLGYFHEHGGRKSHAELCEGLGDRGLDRATIYRILVDLAEASILARTDLGDHVWRFEIRTSGDATEHSDEHPHFVCVDCGEVSCLPELSLQHAKSAKLPKAVTRKMVAVQVKGRCDNCS